MRLHVAWLLAIGAALFGVPCASAESGIWLTAPVDGAVVAPSVSVSFEFGTSWSPGVFPGALALQVARDSSFTDLVLDEQFACPAGFEPSCPSSATGGPFSEGKYYWRIQWLDRPEAGDPVWVPSESRTLVITDETQPAPVPNQPPTARIAVSSTHSQPGELVTLDASESTDGDGSIASYSWTFGNGNGASGSPLTAVSYAQPGAYEVRLVVVDDRGAQAEASVTIVVGSNEPATPEPATPEPSTPDRRPDTVAPTARALPSGGRRGRVIRLRFDVWDDSGSALVEVNVRIKGRIAATLHADGATGWAAWRVPRSARSAAFCVSARDASGNRSATSCLPIRLRADR